MFEFCIAASNFIFKNYPYGDFHLCHMLGDPTAIIKQNFLHAVHNALVHTVLLTLNEIDPTHRGEP
jgi:hypothetical protein